MITLPLTTAWNICTPHLFRYMPEEFVNNFFEDGSIRLSSFTQFHSHEDEQRLDKREGKAMFVSTTQKNGGQTVQVHTKPELNAYVLCTTMIHDSSLMDSFKCDSYIKIMDSTNFGMAVARHIPGVLASFEGPCIYQYRKIIEQDLGYIKMNQFNDTDNPKHINVKALNNFILKKMGHLSLFLKDKSFSHQSEYRYVWLVSNKETDFIDIKVPEIREICTPPNPLTDGSC